MNIHFIPYITLMQRKKFLLVACAILMSLQSTTFALTIDSQIEDELNKEAEKEIINNAKELNEKITFTKVDSCKSMESVMTKFIDTYKELHPKPQNRRYDYPYEYNTIGFATETLNTASIDSDWRSNWRATQDLSYSANIAWSATKSTSISREIVETAWSDDLWEIKDYSKTNIQKVWVDEPDILKSNWEYLFYFAEESYNNQYISIIKTPRKSDLSDAEVLYKIEIPNKLRNIQLFLNWNKLIILWSRSTSSYDSVLWSSRTVVIVYDISNLDNLKLEKLSEVYWYFEDARMIWDQLYLISSINLSWYSIARRDEPVEFNEMMPKLTDINLKKSSGQSVSYEKKTIPLSCNNIFYLLPSEDTMKQTGVYPNFTLISQISLNDLSANTKQSLVFGNVDEIHMSQTSLYLPSPIYFSNPIRCSLWGCYRSWYYRNENTLVHKFNLDKSVKYQDSMIIPWTPLNQYSMDEDNDWNFRILTTTWYNQKATHLSILDKNLKLKWSLLNIEPGENFKSSRYIWDKLYLVTYQNIDPLFVVDMEDSSNPKIIWELKIPGYSTYLHPYSDAKNGIQYLIGLWYSTTDNGYGWLKTDNVKVDLYKIDYNWNETAETKCSSLITKNVDAELTNSCSTISNGRCNEEQRLYEDCLTKVNPDNIAVSLIASHEFTWDSSNSPALNNPRVFVRRSAKQELILPVTIRNTIEKWSYENNWNYKYKTFMGLKWLSIKTSTALIKEFLSQNFADENDKSYRYRDFDDARVWYIDDIYYFLNKWFAAFLTKNGDLTTLGSVSKY